MKIRAAIPDDEPEILTLLESSLGWRANEEHTRFYRWKHGESPFGASYGWVAVDGGRIIGLRLFMRWEFRTGGKILPAVRAVDTATHHDYRGRGVFRKLTLHALEELRREGVAFVFNTPNEQSRPGYLSMGWQVVGRLPVRVRPRSPSVLVRLVRARLPAELSSLPTEVGVPATDVFADPAVGKQLAVAQRARNPQRVTTNRTTAYLAWRYGHQPLAYRTLAPSGAPGKGLIVFRLRRRGPTVEAVVADVLGDVRIRRQAVRELWQAGADHAIALGGSLRLGRALPVPRVGPLLTTRPLASSAPTKVQLWNLSMGDIELL